MDKEILELMAMVKRWKEEADRFFERVNRTGYEPKGDVSHIWANLSGVAVKIDDSVEDYGDVAS